MNMTLIFVLVRYFSVVCSQCCRYWFNVLVIDFSVVIIDFTVVIIDFTVVVIDFCVAVLGSDL